MRHAYLSIVALIAIFIFTTTIVTAQNISTVAGGGDTTGENVSVFVGQITPFSIVEDATGNIYVSDIAHDVIKKISTSGIMTTFAGNGTEGFSGDGGPATNAMLHNPTFMVFDHSGNLLVADILNYRIRKIDPSGIITTIAGIGSAGYNGEGIPAITAKMEPSGLDIDAAGNIYVGDIGNARIRQINTAGIINTIAGNGYYGSSGDGGQATNARLEYPDALKLNRAGDIIFEDHNAYVIRKINMSSGIISGVAGIAYSMGYTAADGAAADTSRIVTNEGGLIVDTFNNIYYCEYGIIRKINAAGILGTVAGSVASSTYSGDGGPATAAMLSTPEGLFKDIAGNILIADRDNYVIRRIDTAGIINTIIGNNLPEFTGDNGQAMNARMLPTVVRADTANNLYFADKRFQIIRKIAPSGIVTRIAGSGVNSLYYIGDGLPATVIPFRGYLSLAPDKKGNVFVSDAYQNQIWKINAGDTAHIIAGTGVSGYAGDGGPATAAKIGYVQSLATDTAGNLFYGEVNWSVVRKISIAGIITTVAGNATYSSTGDGGPATSASLEGARAVAVDMHGNLYIGEDSGRIRKVNTSGTISTFAGTGTLGYSGDGGPATAAHISCMDMSFDSYGNMLLSQLNNVVRKIDTNGIITTIAGTGTPGFSGDGGQATNAKLHRGGSPQADQWGNIYIADDSNARIRFICAHDSITDAITISTAVTTICAGQSVTFTSSATNAGAAPRYQWVISGVPAPGATLNTFTSAALTNGDTVYCLLTGTNTAPCAINNIATSNRIVMVVNAVSATPSSIAVTASPDVVSYAGETITFTATYLNGGSSPTFQWYKNAIAISGATTNPYVSTSVSNGDIITVNVRTSNLCASPDNASSGITMGIEQSSGNTTSIELYPNPNKGSFSIKGVFTMDDAVNIEIISPSGKLIQKTQATVQNHSLSTTINLGTEIMAGLYFIRIQSGTEVNVYRFIVQ